MTTLYLLVLLTVWIGGDKNGKASDPIVVAQFENPYDCDVHRSSLTGSTRSGTVLVCAPAEKTKAVKNEGFFYSSPLDGSSPFSPQETR